MSRILHLCLFLIALFALAAPLVACGKKPSHVDGPPDVKEQRYLQTYPDPLTDPKPEPKPDSKTED